MLRLGRLEASFDRRTTPREDVVAAITGAHFGDGTDAVAVASP